MKFANSELFDTMLDFHRRLVLLDDEINDLLVQSEDDESGEYFDRKYILERLSYCLSLADLTFDLPEILKDN